MTSLWGRGDVVELFREGSAWPRPGGHRLPIVLLLGPAGSGKTLLLRALRAKAANLPHAFVDLEVRNPASSIDVMIDLVNQLSLGHRGLGRLRFPRFWLGVLVTELQFERRSSDERRAEVETLLRQIRIFRRLPDVVKEMVYRLISLTPIPERIVDTTVDLVIQTIKLWRAPAQQWWARRSNQSAADALLRIKNSFDSHDPIERLAVEEELCEALLADLQAAYTNRFRGPDRTVSCVTLIDNVHVEAGAAFLELLARVRIKRVDHPDPLFVLATSRRSLSPRLLLTPVAESQLSDLDTWRRTHDQEHWQASFCPVRLRDLDVDEVEELARTRGLRSRGALASFVHRVTAGRPQGVSAVLALLANRTVPAPLKELAHADGEGALLDELLADVPPTQRAALVSSAAARHISLPAILAAQGYPPHLCVADDAEADAVRDTATQLMGTVSDLMLLRGTGAASELNPWLRRLLLLRLAHRTSDQRESWDAVHGWLRDYYRASDDRVGELYHRLALGDLEDVVRTLDDALKPGEDPVAWTAKFLEVTSAPSRPTDGEPGMSVRQLANWADASSRRLRTLAWLAAAHWVTADPLGDMFGRLAPDIGKRWQDLSGEVPYASDAFFDARQLVLAQHERNGGRVENLSSWRGAVADVQITAAEPERIKPMVSRRRKLLRVSAVAAALAVIGGMVPVVSLVLNSCGDGVKQMGELDECVGITDGSYVFDPRLARVESLILEQNKSIAANEAAATVAVALPMPHDGNGLYSIESVLRELEGAWVAQYEANEQSSRTPKIRLQIANIGHEANLWEPVVEQLTDLGGLRVVAGLGPSEDSTRRALRELDNAGFATIGSVITADDLHGGTTRGGIPKFARVTPSNSDEVAVALDSQLLASNALLVKGKPGNLYTATLANTFQRERPAARIETYDTSDSATVNMSNRMNEIAAEICASKSSHIYFAGRSHELRQLVIAIDDNFCDRPLTVVTGDDATVIDIDPDNDEHAKFTDALQNRKVTVLCTALAHPDQWNKTEGAEIVSFKRFNQIYVKNFGENLLDDGQAMMSHDAVATAIEAIRRGSEGANMWYGIHGTRPVIGATGKIELDENGNTINKAIPILKINPDGSKEFVKLGRS